MGKKNSANATQSSIAINILMLLLFGMEILFIKIGHKYALAKYEEMHTHKIYIHSLKWFVKAFVNAKYCEQPRSTGKR